MRAEIDESELDGLVRMIVWNEEGFAFEYAHFTDAELADGLLAIAPSGPPRDEVVRRVAGARARRANLKVVWALDWAPPKPRKPALAMHLWPGLSALIEAARSGSSAIPIAVLAAAREVMALAGQYPRQHGVVLRRRGRPEPSSSSEPEPTAGKAE
jgi:hypothetical protein